VAGALLAGAVGPAIFASGGAPAAGIVASTDPVVAVGGNYFATMAASGAIGATGVAAGVAASAAGTTSIDLSVVGGAVAKGGAIAGALKNGLGGIGGSSTPDAPSESPELQGPRSSADFLGGSAFPVLALAVVALFALSSKR
jgi:hypothetical protein